MSKYVMLAAVLLLGPVSLSTNVSAQSCGCDTIKTCATCSNSCDGQNAHVTLHIKTSDCGCKNGNCNNGCRQRCGLIRRPSINIAPAANVAAPALPQVAIQRAAIQPVQAVAYQPVQTIALQPLQTFAYQPQTTMAMTQTRQMASPQNCCEVLDEKIAELATEVKKVTQNVNDLIDVVDRHDRILRRLVEQNRN